MRVCNDPIGLQKAVLWEQAKGLLRAVVAADGAQQSQYDGQDPHFMLLEKEVEGFIRDFEDHGYHE